MEIIDLISYENGQSQTDSNAPKFNQCNLQDLVSMAKRGSLDHRFVFQLETHIGIFVFSTKTQEERTIIVHEINNITQNYSA